MEPLLVRAARRQRVERTPVWFMRQAGRSLPEYRSLRERHSFWEVAETPELCAEVTLQPVRRHEVDAAVSRVQMHRLTAPGRSGTACSRSDAGDPAAAATS